MACLLSGVPWSVMTSEVIIFPDDKSFKNENLEYGHGYGSEYGYSEAIPDRLAEQITKSDYDYNYPVEGEVSFLRITTRSNQPIPWGGACLGRYAVIENMTVNYKPVFKHEFFPLYMFSLSDGAYCVGTNLDVTLDGCIIRYENVNNYYDEEFARFATVWNRIEQRFEEQPLIQISPGPDEAEGEVAPCKVFMNSEGPLGGVYPDQMGVYFLVTNASFYGRPVYRHRSGRYYLKVDQEGSWIVSDVTEIFPLGKTFHSYILVFSLRICLFWYSDLQWDASSDPGRGSLVSRWRSRGTGHTSG